MPASSEVTRRTQAPVSYDDVFKQVNEQIKSWGDIQAERQKIQASILTNQIKEQQNLFYKVQEKMRLDPMQQQQLDYQKKLGSQYDQQQQPAGSVGASTLDELSQPRVSMGTNGYQVQQPDKAVFMIGYLKKKIDAGKADEADKAMYDGLMQKKFGSENVDKSIENKILQGTATPEEVQRYKSFKAISRKDEVSYTDEFRSSLQDAAQRIGNGEDYKAITHELMQKYRDKMSFTVTDNLTQVAKQAKVDLGKYRNQAIQELKRSKYPITENNIKVAIKQLRGGQ